MKKTLFILSLMLLVVSCGDGNNEDEIPVQSIPQLSTKPIIHITNNTAVSGGVDIDDGGSAISKKGMCWSRVANPNVISDEFSLDGNGSQSYISDLKQMLPNTTYYARAYATNFIGTGYGNEFSFTTDDGGYPLNVYNGDVFFYGQADVDNFGANHYTHVTGGMYFERSSGTPITRISNIAALNSVTTIQGYLRIEGTSLLTNLDGFQNLEEVGLDIFIKNNQNLISVEEFSSLRVVGGGITIEGNNALEHIDGFYELTTSGGLIIFSNIKLVDIDGFSNLTKVTSILNIAHNDSLENINGLTSLSEVSVLLEIGDNNILTNIDGLSSLTTVGNIINPSTPFINGLSIYESNNLNNIDGLSNLTSFSGNFLIYNNPVLANLDGLISMNSVNWSLSIRGNPMISNLNGLSNITAVGGLDVLGNNNLSSLVGLGNITSVEDGIDVKDNSMLTDLCDIQLLIQNGFSGAYVVSGNAFNPTQQDIIDGNCSQ